MANQQEGGRARMATSSKGWIGQNYLLPSFKDMDAPKPEGQVRLGKKIE
jgi:hypothetical protein